MTMPRGPFPEVLTASSLYEDTRVTGLRRRRRKAAAAATGGALSLVAAVALGISATAPAPARSTLLAPDARGPSTDAELVALAPRCDDTCRVAGRTELADGSTFGIVSRPSSTGLVTVAFVVANGNALVDRLLTGELIMHASAPRTDSTGNVLVFVDGGNNSVWWLPFRVEAGRLTLRQGTLAAPTLVGDVNSALVDDGHGRLDVVTVNHRATPDGTGRISTYRRWTWSGRTYVARACVVGGSTSGVIGCGLPR